MVYNTLLSAHLENQQEVSICEGEAMVAFKGRSLQKEVSRYGHLLIHVIAALTILRFKQERMS